MRREQSYPMPHTRYLMKVQTWVRAVPCEVVVECHGNNLISGKKIRSRGIGRRNGRVGAGNLESSKLPVPEYGKGE